MKKFQLREFFQVLFGGVLPWLQGGYQLKNQHKKQHQAALRRQNYAKVGLVKWKFGSLDDDISRWWHIIISMEFPGCLNRW